MQNNPFASGLVTHCGCIYDTLNPQGSFKHTHTAHPAAGQRAKEDGCHEGSQHWFLQAKPLARVVPGHFASAGAVPVC